MSGTSIIAQNSMSLRSIFKNFLGEGPQTPLMVGHPLPHPPRLGASRL